ncbi:MAG: YibE/F family protein [Synergistales bacterium]|nr:YibE/F family protein [Synergistales bacterium]
MDDVRNLGVIVLVALFTVLVGYAAGLVTEAVFIARWDRDDAWLVRLHRVSAPREQRESRGEWATVTRNMEVTVLAGEGKGGERTVEVEHLKESRLRMEPGKLYVLSTNRFEDGTVVYFLSDRFRLPEVIGFLVAVAVFLCLAAGGSGVRALLGLLLSLGLLAGWGLPAMLAGTPPVLVALLSVAAIAALTIVVVLRRRRCWVVAFAGAVGGAVGAFLVGWFTVAFWQLNGLGSQEGALLAGTLPALSMRGVLLASVIIGAIGAVLDVAISITSAMSELAAYDEQIPGGRLFQAGMNVGRDVLGSMINTLILAYFGSSLVVALLIAASGTGFFSLLNDPMIAQELCRGVAGTVGLLSTIPLTSFAGMLLLSGEREPDSRA